MEVLQDSTISSNFNRRKGIQKRHSVTSCLKQKNKPRFCEKRRVSFCKEKTVHLINKENNDNMIIYKSPKDKNILEKKEENIDFLNEPLDYNSLDNNDNLSDNDNNTEILNETMAIDFTNDFTAQLLDFTDDDTLSNLIEQDDSLLLQSSSFDNNNNNNTQNNNDSSSEITFLGGQLDVALSNTSPLELSEQDNTFPIMELDNPTEELFAQDNTNNDKNILENGEKTMNIDDDFSAKFDILDQISEKIELGTTLTEPLSNLIEADTQETEDLSKILPFDEINPEEDDKTENFLLDSTDNILNTSSSQNLSQMFNNISINAISKSSYSGLRETPVQTPLHLNRNNHQISENISVDDFLSRIHIHFRIFDSIQKHSSISLLNNIDNNLHEYNKNDILIPYLEEISLISPRLNILIKKNQSYSKEISEIKDSLSDLIEQLSLNNPKCFNSSILSRKQLKEYKKQVQLYSKLLWYNDGYKDHKEYNKHLLNILNILQESNNKLEEQITNISLPEKQSILECFISPSLQLEENQSKLEQLSDTYDILTSICEWELLSMKDNTFNFTYNNEYSITIIKHQSVNEQYNLNINYLSNISLLKRSLFESIDLNKNITIENIKQIPTILDNISYWIGKIDDILIEIQRIQDKCNIFSMDCNSLHKPGIISFKFSQLQEYKKSLFPKTLNELTLIFDFNIKTYPNNIICNDIILSNSELKTEVRTIIENTMEIISSNKYPYGRFEEISLKLLGY